MSLFLFFCHLPLYAQDAFKITFAGLKALPVDDQSSQVPNQAAERITLMWSQTARRLGTDSSFQTRPLLSMAYDRKSSWAIAFNYDFQSFSFEYTQAFTSSRFGYSVHLIPELKSFSTKAGPWFQGQINERQNYLLMLQVASLNSSGYGLWAEELRPSSNSRVWTIPILARYRYQLNSITRIDLAYEFQSDLGQEHLRASHSMYLALQRDLSW